MKNIKKGDTLAYLIIVALTIIILYGFSVGNQAITSSLDLAETVERQLIISDIKDAMLEKEQLKNAILQIESQNADQRATESLVINDTMAEQNIDLRIVLDHYITEIR